MVSCFRISSFRIRWAKLFAKIFMECFNVDWLLPSAIHWFGLDSQTHSPVEVDIGSVGWKYMHWCFIALSTLWIPLYASMPRMTKRNLGLETFLVNFDSVKVRKRNKATISISYISDEMRKKRKLNRSKISRLQFRYCSATKIFKCYKLHKYMLEPLKAISIFVRMNCLSSRGPHTFLNMKMSFSRGTEKKRETAFLVKCYM